MAKIIDKMNFSIPKDDVQTLLLTSRRWLQDAQDEVQTMLPIIENMASTYPRSSSIYAADHREHGQHDAQNLVRYIGTFHFWPSGKLAFGRHHQFIVELMGLSTSPTLLPPENNGRRRAQLDWQRAIRRAKRIYMCVDLPAQSQLEQLSRVVERQNAQLRALNEANLLLSEERLVSSVLQRVVDISRELSGARYAALGVLDDNGRLKAFLTSGIDEASRDAINELPTGRGLLGLMLERTKPLRVDNISKHPNSVGFPPGHPDMTSFLGVPIRYKGRAVGSLYLTNKDGDSTFDDDDEEIVSLFANQAAVAIQNAQLNEQIQALAVETERTRISREMHDGLAQVLGYINTKAQAVQQFLANKEFQTAEDHLKEMSDSARQAYRDVREGILALRTQVGEDRSFSDALNEFISEFQHQLGRSTEVRQVIPETLNLSHLQEVQILRIVQEALTNVRKHAQASTVWVTIVQRNEGLEIEVRDDGRGFNPLAIKRGEWPHLGLQTMQERAEAIGGTFEIDSASDKGTKIRVVIPHSPRVGPKRGER